MKFQDVMINIGAVLLIIFIIIHLIKMGAVVRAVVKKVDCISMFWKDNKDIYEMILDSQHNVYFVCTIIREEGISFPAFMLCDKKDVTILGAISELYSSKNYSYDSAIEAFLLILNSKESKKQTI